MKKYLAIYLLVSIALSFFLYGNTLDGEFIYDDKFFAAREELREAGYLKEIWLEPFIPSNITAGTYRPLTVFSFSLNFILFGESTTSFHAINIILNGLVIFLVFLLILKIFGNKNLAIFSALFFAFLPIHTEAVAFIKAREELLASLFILLSWLLFIKATRNPGIKYSMVAISVVLFILGILSKELFIAAPILFLSVYYVKEKVSLSKLIKVGSFYALSMFVYLTMRYQALGEYAFGKDDTHFIINSIRDAPFWARIWTAFKIAFVYIGKTFVPINLSATYHYNHLTLVSNPLSSIEAILGVLLLGILVFIIFNKKYRKTPLGIGAIIFIIPYLVISKLIFKGGDILAERWLYFPTLGLSLIGAYFLTKIYENNRKFGIAVSLVIFGIYTSIILPRNNVWASDEILYQDMINTAPNSIKGHQNLAKIYLERDEIENARKEVEIAFSIYKEHAPVLNLIGIIAFYDGNYELAETAFLKAIEVRPKLTISYGNIGRLYYEIGDYKKSAQYLEFIINNFSTPAERDIRLYISVLEKMDMREQSQRIKDKFDIK